MGSIREAMSTRDVASTSNGGCVSFASSYDDQNPANNIVDGDPRTFWASTGLYPQEFVVELDRTYDIAVVNVAMANVKSFTIEKSDSDQPTNYQMVSGPVQLGNDSSASRTEIVEKQITLSGTRARHVKFTILDGWSDFCAVYRVSLEGN